MSRLPPAMLGIAGPRQIPASKQHQAFENDVELQIDRIHILSREAVDASLQRGDLASGTAIAWHPRFPILAVATSASVAEYDAISGCRRNLVESSGSPIKLKYSSDGSQLVLLTKQRNITAWSTTTWRRRALLVAEARYANRPLVSGLLTLGAASQGQSPVVYYSPIGKCTLRTVHMSAPQPAAKGQTKPDKEYVPGYKLKTDNKKPIVGLSAHPTDPSVLFVLLIDGTVMACSVGAGGGMSTLCAVAVPFDAGKERAQLHAVPHPTRSGGTLVIVEAERSGLTLLTLANRHEVRVLACLPLGAGALSAGVGLLHKSCILVAAVRHAGGNVGFRAWRLLGSAGGGELTVVSLAPMPATVWDVLQGTSSSDASSLADVSGEARLAGMMAHGPSGMLAFWTSRHDESGAAHFRLPLLAVTDGGDVQEGLGAAHCMPLHTGPKFWTAGAGGLDGTVPKLRFPRYAYLLNSGKVCSYDMTHGMQADVMALPTTNAFGQERLLVRATCSHRQGTWLAFCRLLTVGSNSGGGSGGEGSSPLGPGMYEFTAVSESEASVAAGRWWMPGRDGTFVGGRDEQVAVVSNSGRLVAMFETAKLMNGGAKAQFVAEIKGAAAVRIFPGPPAHIPPAPKPRPASAAAHAQDANEDDDATAGEHFDDRSDEDEEAEQALREWEQGEARRLEAPKRVVLYTVDNALSLREATVAGLSGGGNGTAKTATRGSSVGLGALQLSASEALVEFAWQTLVDPTDDFHAGRRGAATAVPCVAAVLTTSRAVLTDHRLDVVASVSFPSDAGIPTSCLWVGPGLLVTTSANQIFVVRWDGTLTHGASLLSGPPPTLLAALADRLVLAARGEGAGVMAGRTEVASRGFPILPVLLAGWAGVAFRGILPGGAERARSEMRALLASYDASRLSLSILDTLATAGFPRVAAAAAAASELPEVTPARRAALAAAAGDWNPVLALVESELEECEVLPPPQTSQTYRKAVAVARALEAHGRFAQARELFAAVGAWNELLALCVFQGDFSALHSYARQGGREVEALAAQLAAVNENAFRRSTAVGGVYGGRPVTQDWLVERRPDASQGADGSLKRKGKAPSSPSSPHGNVNASSSPRTSLQGGAVFDNEAVTNDDRYYGNENGGLGLDGHPAEDDWEVAPAGRLPYMEASLAVTPAAAASGTVFGVRRRRQQENEEDQEDEGQPIAALDLTSLDAYLGVAGATIAAHAVPQAAAAAGGLSLVGRGDTLESSEFGAAAAMLGGREGAALRGGGEAESIADSEAEMAAAAIGDVVTVGDSSSVGGGAGTASRGAVAGAGGGGGESAAQSAARAAFGGKDKKSTGAGLIDDMDDFFSSDEESNPADADARSGGSFAAATSNRFLFNIRSPAATSGVGPSDPGALRLAAQSLRLGGPGSPKSTSSGGVAAAMSRSQSAQRGALTATSAGSSFSSEHGFPSLLPPPPPPAAAPGQTLNPSTSAVGSEDDPFSAFDVLPGPAPSPVAAAASSATAQRGGGPKDPFAALPGLPPSIGQQSTNASTTPAPPTTTTTTTTAGGAQPHQVSRKSSAPLPLPLFEEQLPLANAPMRPQPAAPVSQSDLLAGWDDFEALFGGVSTETAPPQSSQPSTSGEFGAASRAVPVAPPAPQTSISQPSRPVANAVPTTTTAAGEQLSPALKRRHTAAMETFTNGHWAKASELFAACLEEASKQRRQQQPASTPTEEFRELCLQQYAASLLVQRAAPAPPAAASRLARFAVGLRTGELVHAAAAAFAVEANMAAGNFGWAGDQLTWLVVVAAEGEVRGPGLDSRLLQERLAACDRAGGRDAMPDAGEDVESFVEIVASCGNKAEVDELIANLVQQG